MLSRVIAKNIGDGFFETQCIVRAAVAGNARRRPRVTGELMAPAASWSRQSVDDVKQQPLTSAADSLPNMSVLCSVHNGTSKTHNRK